MSLAPGLRVRSESASLFLFCAMDMFHGEAEIGDNLLEGNTVAAVAEVVVGSAKGATVFLNQVVFIAAVDYNFEEAADRADLAGGSRSRSA